MATGLLSLGLITRYFTHQVSVLTERSYLNCPDERAKSDEVFMVECEYNTNDLILPIEVFSERFLEPIAKVLAGKLVASNALSTFAPEIQKNDYARHNYQGLTVLAIPGYEHERDKNQIRFYVGASKTFKATADDHHLNAVA